MDKASLIYRITAYSKTMLMTECYNHMNAMRSATEERFQDLDYYAMGDNEMFFDDTRTFTLECAEVKGGAQLIQEYADDKIAK